MNIFITLLLSLIVVHVIVDFYCQPNSWIQDKSDKKFKSPKLAYHSLMHAVASCLPMLLATQDWQLILLFCLVVAISHWLIDLGKSYAGKQLRFFVIDQLLHILVLAGIAVYVSGVEIVDFAILESVASAKNLAIVLGYVIIFKPTSILIGLVLKKYTPQGTPESSGLMAGGEMIGYLERALILTFIIIGQYSIIGFILAAKSIFRFGELNNSKNHNLTEYVLLGSLLSVTITSLVGILNVSSLAL